MEKYERELHPLPPFFPSGARVLMLGSFPPKRERWKMDFFYPNFQNDMWRIFGLVFFEDADYFLTVDRKLFREEAIREFLAAKGIALWDTAMEVKRLKGNASDKFLEVLRPVDLPDVLAKLPCCKAIALTGQKATDTLLTLIEAGEPRVGGFTDT
ncbi:MAG: uracil-DNA glycosylase family protein, partial [Tannerella sp.]|nr:uracil-DNA glycosylase family protein [Tannerella sp.]